MGIIKNKALSNFDLNPISIFPILHLLRKLDLAGLLSLLPNLCIVLPYTEKGNVYWIVILNETFIQ